MWTDLKSPEQLERITEESHFSDHVIFKHSTRCSISRVALGRFERTDSFNKAATYHLLDLLAHRPISNAIAERFGITHESPQVLVIRNGVCIYQASHLDIEPAEISEQVGSSGSESL